MNDQTKTSSTKLLVWLAYASCALLWGTGWYATRLCMSSGGYPVFGGAALRYTIAAAVLGLVCYFVPKMWGKVSKSQLLWIVVSALFNGAGVALIFWGAKSISGGLVAVLSATTPIMAAILALITKTERITSTTIAGFCIALAGIGIIFGERMCVSPEHVMPMIASLGSALMFALVNMLMKVKVGDVKPIQSSSLFFLSMAIMLWAVSPLEGAALSMTMPVIPTCALLYIAIGGSVLAFPLFLFILRHSSLMLASTLAFVHPIIAIITDCAFEKDMILTASAYIGISVVLAGVMLSLTAKAPKPATIPQTVASEAAGEAFAA